MTKAYFLNEADLAIIKTYIQSEMNRRQNDTAARPADDAQLPPEVYIAYSSSGIPAITTAPSGTGTVYTPNSSLCDIYSIDVDSGKLTHRVDFSKTVYNLASTAVPAGWLVIQRDKFGQWVCGLGASNTTTGGGGGTSFGSCLCFNCITPAQATVGGCVECPNGAAYQYTCDIGTWGAYPTLSNTLTLTYVSDCTWASPNVTITTGTGSGESGVYHWVLTMAGANTTLQLMLVSGTDIIGVS